MSVSTFVPMGRWSPSADLWTRVASRKDAVPALLRESVEGFDGRLAYAVLRREGEIRRAAHSAPRAHAVHLPSVHC